MKKKNQMEWTVWLIDFNSHHKRLQVFEIVTFIHYILKVIKKNLDTFNK